VCLLRMIGPGACPARALLAASSSRATQRLSSYETWAIPSSSSLPAASSRSLPGKAGSCYAAWKLAQDVSAGSAAHDSTYEAVPSSTVSLMPASTSSLPDSNGSGSHLRDLQPVDSHRRFQPDHNLEMSPPWSMASMIEALQGALSSPGHSADQSSCESVLPLSSGHSAVQSRGESVLPPPGHIAEHIDAAESSFLLPSALIRIDGNPELRTDGGAMLDQQAGRSLAQGVHERVFERVLAKVEGVKCEEANVACRMPTRELSPNVLAHLEESLRHALDCADAMEQVRVPTARPSNGSNCDYSMRGRKARPSNMAYP
jgi:hypothetical protein